MPVLHDFMQAIKIQQEKEDQNYEEQIELPIDERVAKGVTMNNVRVEFDFYEEAPNPWCPLLSYPYKFVRLARIHSQNNISKFRVGGRVVLSNGKYALKMEIVEDTVDNFSLAPNDFDVKECYVDSQNYDPNNWEVNLQKTSLTLKLLSATAGHLNADGGRRNTIEQLLGGQLKNSHTASGPYTQLNASQNKAIARAMGASHFHLIQGPPGTGKTKTVAHIAKLLVEAGKNVFVTAPTHTAINNCLNAIADEVKDASKVVKIGEKYQAAEILDNPHVTRKTRLPLERYTFDKSVSHDGIIIGGTPYCFCYPASKRLNNWEFDVALIDEAAQLSIPMAVTVMSKTDKFIFVGDHRQLDPIIPSGTGLSMFSESIFSRLVRLYPGEKDLLNISYRLNEKLIRVPNALFYDNELTSAPSLANATHPHMVSDKYSELLNSSDAKVLFLHHEFDSKGRSPYEAEIVAGLVKDLLSNGVKLKDIGMLTPYRAQVREIKKALSKGISGIDPEAIFVDTVDRMQGQERDYILYSMSNSHPLESKRRLEFFYSPNRLNVAITRARKKCIVIANAKVFEIIDEELTDIPEYAKLKPSLDIFKRYFQLSTKVEEEQVEDAW